MLGGPYRPPQTWDTWGNFPDWLVPRLWQRTPRSSRRDEGADRACGRVGVCMSVDTERHTLTHTHSHARTHAGPSAAPPAPPHRPSSPSKLLSRDRAWPVTSHDPRRTGVAALWSPPAREGDGERAPRALTAWLAECAREPRVPPRHVGRTSGDAAAGEGPAELPRPGPPSSAPARPHCALTCCELRCPSSVVPAEGRVSCLPVQSTGKPCTF